MNLSAKEGGLVARAAVSSLAATIVDGVFYQLMLAFLTRAGTASAYVTAALVGAVAGAVTNFVLNRYWAFRSKGKRIWVQGTQYAVGSLLTLLLLEAFLWFLIEKVGLDARVAWLPAKVVVWIAFSYPFQRVFVFAGAER